MKAIQNPPRFKSKIKLSEEIKIILLMLLATAVICFEYHMNRSEQNNQAENHMQSSMHLDPANTGNNNIEIHLKK